jgi:hypothetical protein
MVNFVDFLVESDQKNAINQLTNQKRIAIYRNCIENLLNAVRMKNIRFGSVLIDLLHFFGRIPPKNRPNLKIQNCPQKFKIVWENLKLSTKVPRPKGFR